MTPSLRTRIAAGIAMLGGAVWFMTGAVHASRPELHPELVQTRSSTSSSASSPPASS